MFNFGGGGPPARTSADTSVPPSRVLFFSHLPMGTTHNDLHGTVAPYGRPVSAIMMSNRSQMLVQMSTLDEAIRVVDASFANRLAVHGHPVRATFSRSVEIASSQALRFDEAPPAPSHGHAHGGHSHGAPPPSYSHAPPPHAHEYAAPPPSAGGGYPGPGPAHAPISVPPGYVLAPAHAHAPPPHAHAAPPGYTLQPAPAPAPAPMSMAVPPGMMLVPVGAGAPPPQAPPGHHYVPAPAPAPHYAHAPPPAHEAPHHAYGGGGGGYSGGSSSGGHALLGAPGGSGHESSHGHGQPAQPRGPGRVLLIQITNAAYPITVEVLSAILRPHGDLCRLFICDPKERDAAEKRRQAFAEYRRPEEARAAMEALQGRNIYDGSCLLRLQLSHQETVIVRENNERGWDWTGALSSSSSSGGGDRDRGFGDRDRDRGGDRFGRDSRDRGGDRFGDRDRERGGDRYGRDNRERDGGGSAARGPYAAIGGVYTSRELAEKRPELGGGGGGGGGRYGAAPAPAAAAAGPAPGSADAPTSVVMIYNLPEPPALPEGQASLPADALFNLACCYGDVMRVRMLPKPAGECSAMVEMANPRMASVLLEALNRLPLSSRDAASARPLHITASRQTTLTDARAVPSALGKPGAPPTPAGADLVDYASCPLHRFSRGLPSKLPYGPCSTLYFGNLPLHMSEAGLSDALAAVGAPRPTAIKFLQGQGDGSSGSGSGGGRDKAGFADFGDATTAAYALLFGNHMPLDGGATFLRLSFASRRMSTAPERHGGHGGHVVGGSAGSGAGGARAAHYDAAADGAPDGLSAVGASSGAEADHVHDSAAAQGEAAAAQQQDEQAGDVDAAFAAEAGATEAAAGEHAVQEEARAYSPTGAADL